MDDEFSANSTAGSAGERLSLKDLEHLHRSPSPAEREELLECLLITASQGGDAVIRVLEELVLSHALDELLKEHRRQTGESG